MTTQQEQNEVERPPQFGDAGFKPAAHADDDELARVEAELAKEEAGDAGTEAETAEDAELTTEEDPGTEETHEEARPDTAKQPPAPTKTPTIMIPKQRLDEVLQDREQLLQRLARLEGAVTVMANGKPMAQGEQPKPEPTPQERIDALKADVDKLSEQFESGEIGTREFTRQQFDLQEKIFDIKQEMVAPRATAPAQDTYLLEQTNRLATEFDILAKISADDIEAITPLALRDARVNKVDISNDLALRRHIAATAQRIYGGTPNTQPAAGGKPPGPDQNRVEQGRAKLRLAQSAPPNLNAHAVNYSASSGGVPTAEQFASMTEDQRAALPDAVLAKLAS